MNYSYSAYWDDDKFIVLSDIQSLIIYTKKNILEFNQLLQSINYQTQYEKMIIHIFYEYSYFIYGLESLIKLDDILAICIVFKKKQSYDSIPWEQKEWGKVSSLFGEYQQYYDAFLQGYNHLKKGNLYQFNLTFPHLFWVDNPIMMPFFPKMYSKFSHATYLQELNICYISNTPEVLFEITEKNLITRPIKGTGPHKELLLEDKKNINELAMITDLMRNDLSKLNPFKAMVQTTNQLLAVPGLWHLYSDIRVPLLNQTTLFDIIYCLFPGGSITGCPKKKCIEILYTLEKGQSRGFYTGTSVFWKKKCLVGTINIRSAIYNIKNQKLEINAGGGITLLSDCLNEFAEMKSKVHSVLIGLGQECLD